MIDFAFGDARQDIDRFHNAPYWAERFGDEQLTNDALAGPNFTKPLPPSCSITGIIGRRWCRHSRIAGSAEGLGYLTEDKYVDGTTGFVRDICPFTTMGMINRGITNENRKIIAAELAKFLGVTIPVPDSLRESLC